MLLRSSALLALCFAAASRSHFEDLRLAGEAPSALVPLVGLSSVGVARPLYALPSRERDLCARTLTAGRPSGSATIRNGRRR
eukprot:1725289-Pleurochrysis_carterae.AAC.1